MKQTYIHPKTIVELAHCEMLLAASRFDINVDEQSVTLSGDEYNGEFSVKEYSFGDDFGE